MARPTAVTVIGWLYVGFGALMGLGGIMGLAMSVLVPFHAVPGPGPDGGPFAVLTQVFRYFWLLAAIQFAVAILMVSAGAAFLRLRAWSRPVLETLAWVGLLYDLGCGVFWVWTVSSFPAPTSPPPDGPGWAFNALFVGFGVVTILVFAIPLIIVVRSLRSATVRNALRPSGV